MSALIPTWNERLDAYRRYLAGDPNHGSDGQRPEPNHPDLIRTDPRFGGFLYTQLHGYPVAGRVLAWLVEQGQCRRPVIHVTASAYPFMPPGSVITLPPTLLYGTVLHGESAWGRATTMAQQYRKARQS